MNHKKWEFVAKAEAEYQETLGQSVLLFIKL